MEGILKGVYDELFHIMIAARCREKAALLIGLIPA